MRMFRPLAALILLTLVVSLSACGNKGDLVKPTSPGAQAPSAQPPAPDAAKPERDSGH
jgi:predicted small lipoprotein YifL